MRSKYAIILILVLVMPLFSTAFFPQDQTTSEQEYLEQEWEEFYVSPDTLHD